MYMYNKAISTFFSRTIPLTTGHYLKGRKRREKIWAANRCCFNSNESEVCMNTDCCQAFVYCCGRGDSKTQLWGVWRERNGAGRESSLLWLDVQSLTLRRNPVLKFTLPWISPHPHATPCTYSLYAIPVVVKPAPSSPLFHFTVLSFSLHCLIFFF